MNYLDLFSGIGGFALGFQQTGYRFNKHYFSEIDKYAIQIYQKHFPEAIGLGDVSKVDGTKLGQIDLITFGFPCQDLSIAGKRKGLQGSRSGLFFEATRLICECKPRVFIFENVKGLLFSNNGKDFETVLREIADIGLYECEWQLLNTSWFLPQNRERIYFIGHLGEGSGQKVFPIGTDEKLFNQKTNNEITSCFQSTYYKGGVGAGHTLICNELDYIGAIMSKKNKKWLENGKELQRNFPQGQRVYSINGIGSSICGQAGGLGGKTGLYCIPVLTPDRKDKRQNGRRFKNDGEDSFTITGQDKHGIYDGFNIRRLTPTEGLRLQGFPDDYLNGSDTKKYIAIGNAVSVPVVKAIAEKLCMEDI